MRTLRDILAAAVFRFLPSAAAAALALVPLLASHHIVSGSVNQLLLGAVSIATLEGAVFAFTLRLLLPKLRLYSATSDTRSAVAGVSAVAIALALLTFAPDALRMTIMLPFIGIKANMLALSATDAVLGIGIPVVSTASVTAAIYSPWLLPRKSGEPLRSQE
jgi:hypothetical protein